MTERPLGIETVRENSKRLREQVAEAAILSGRRPEDIRLMAVTKTVPPELVNEAAAQGITLLGENKAQELCTKFESYRPEAEIHFIGHLQTNKVRQIADKVSCIQSLDSIRLAQEISRQAKKQDKPMKVLVELNVGRETAKAGIFPEQLPEFLQEVSSIPYLEVEGLMAIPPGDAGEYQTEKFFYDISRQFLDTKARKIDNINMYTLSMGMSGDFRLAIKHGSTLVRIGSALFGRRIYP